MLSWPTAQDPDDIRVRGFDWGSWIDAGAGRTTISSATVTVVTGTVTATDQQIVGAIVRFQASGGADGETAEIRCRVVFDNGEQVDQTASLRIRSN